MFTTVNIAIIATRTDVREINVMSLIMRLNLFLFLISILTAGNLTAADIKITYISSEAVYIDGGTVNGLNLGDSLKIYRNDSLQAILMVTNISSGSSACTIINQT